MKKALAVLLIVAVSSAHAVTYRDDPLAPFKATGGELLIEWKVADNAQKACDAESKKRNGVGFSYQVEACAFWAKNTCTIITSKKTTMHTVGHEMRHCFQGDWHPQ